MKKILLISIAIIFASLVMAQFEKDYLHSDKLEQCTHVSNPITSSSFDRSQILNESKTSSRSEIQALFKETFDEPEGSNTWSCSMTHNESLANLDWKIGSEPDNPYNWTKDGELKSPMLNYFKDQTVASFSKSQGKFAYFNAIAITLNSEGASKHSSRTQAHLTIGPFDFSDVINPVVRWTQFYRKFNYDECYISYSTNNVDFTAIRVNDISSGWGTINNNLGFLPQELAGQSQVYLRFTFQELESETPNHGAGYGWQIDDVEILNNVNYEIKLEKIATEFFFRSEKNLHSSSSFMRIPREEFDNNANILFSTTYINNGEMPVRPKLEVKVINPNGLIIYDKSHLKEGQPTARGKKDTLFMPVEKNLIFDANASTPIEVIKGEYQVLYNISIPNEMEFSLENNQDTAYFYITEDGSYTRDFDKTSSFVGPSSWSDGGFDGDQVGTTYYFHKTTKIQSVDVFISDKSFPDNAFSIMISRPVSGGGFEIIAESEEVVLTPEMIGKWNNIKIKGVEIYVEENSIEKIYVMVQMQYHNPIEEQKHIYIAGDPNTKASIYGVLWYLKQSSNDKMHYISNASPLGLCLRVNTHDLTDISEQVADNLDVKLFPNPSNDFINLEVSQEIMSIELLSLMGKTISKHTVNDNMFSFSTHNLANGNYFLRIITADSIHVEQFSVFK